MTHLKKTMCVFLSFVLTFSSVQVVPSHAVAVDTLPDMSTEPLGVESPAPTQPAGGTPATMPSEEPAATPEKTPEDISQWQALQRMLDEAQDAATIVLDADYTAEASDAGLEIPANKSITLDLAGHTLNRNLTSPVEDGHVILVRGSLSIVDSTATAGIGGMGTITGGKTQNGGGIFVDTGASLRFEGGNITGNESENGGGIFVGPDATLHLAGGIISGNTARGPGGGVLVDSGAKAVIVEGAPVVRSNTANDSGANVFLPTGFVLTMGEALASEAEVGIALEWGTSTLAPGASCRPPSTKSVTVTRLPSRRT